MSKSKLLIFILLLVSCSNANNEWIYLFDGETTNGWMAYNGKEIPKKLAAIDGELTFNTDLKLEKDWIGGGDIIYYKEQFEFF